MVSGVSPDCVLSQNSSKSENLMKIHTAEANNVKKEIHVPTLKCLSIGTPKAAIFSIYPKWKIIVFRCPSI